MPDRLKYLAGSEIGAGVFTADTLPEQKARELQRGGGPVTAAAAAATGRLRAPGRVNLIGEHTDYNGGFVLPTPIPQRTRVELVRRADQRVVASSAELGESARTSSAASSAPAAGSTTSRAARSPLRTAGHHLGGADLHITSDVPLGSGLSSSAALEIAVLRALRAAYELPIDDVALALLGQRAENELVGAPCGAMDQLVASLGEPGAALFIDMQSLAARRVPLPTADLLVISSGSATTTPAATTPPGAPSARPPPARSASARCASSPPTTCRASCACPIRSGGARATSSPRTRACSPPSTRSSAATSSSSATCSGRRTRRCAMTTRSPSRRSTPWSSSRSPTPRSFGARLTGGGFGGSIVAIAQPGSGARIAPQIAAAYATRTGLTGRVLLAGGVPRCDPS